MTMEQVRRLHAGDEVHWNDPDDGICSRTLTIKSIEVKGEHVCVEDADGAVVECFPRELG